MQCRDFGIKVQGYSFNRGFRGLMGNSLVVWARWSGILCLGAHNAQWGLRDLGFRV